MEGDRAAAPAIKNKKVVVTGGAGFIGSHLAEELSPENRVIILDDLSGGRLENIGGLLQNPQVSFVRGSVTDLPLLRRLFEGVDYVFHLAALTGVPQSAEDPLAFDEVNARGTLNVLVAARDSGVKKVVYASSCAVYGENADGLPQREDQPPQPLSPYAAAKLAGEAYCLVFSHLYALPTVSLRYFNVFGPRQDSGGAYAAVIPAFFKRVLAGLPPLIYGDGEQKRDFIFVKDVVRANILAAAGTLTGIFNVGTGRAVTINELAGDIITVTGGENRRLAPVYTAPRPGDPRVSLADTEKAAAAGFVPSYSLRAGLEATLRGLPFRRQEDSR